MAERRMINGWIVEKQADGSLVTIGPANGGGPAMPADPGYQYEGPKAQADLQGSQLDNRYKEVQIQESTAGKLPTGYRRTPDGGAELIPGVPAPKDPNAPAPPSGQAVRAAHALLDNLIKQNQVYIDDFAGWSPMEYNPWGQGSERLNNYSTQMLPFAKQFMRVPGEGSQSDRDATDYRALLPQNSARDQTNLDRMINLRDTALNILRDAGQDVSAYETFEPGKAFVRPALGQRRDDTATTFIGAPGGGQSGPGGGAPMDPFGQGGPTVLPNAAGVKEAAPMQANDVTSKGGLTPISELAGYENQVIDLIGRGASEDQVIGYMNEQLSPYGANVGGELRAWIGGIIDKHRANPRQPVRSLGQGWEMLYHKKAPEEQQSFLGIDPDSTVGNFAAQGSNAMLAGAPAYFAGKQDVLGAAARERPGSTLAGEVVGGTAGMLGVNRVAGTLGKAGSLLTRSGGVGGDMAFGATRGAFDGGPEGAVVGGLVAGLGNKVGGGAVRTIGRGVRGVSDPAVRYLAERGVPMTVGQLLGNRGLLGKTMNKLESLPGIGESLAARRIESMTAFNRAAMEDAGAPIGFNPSNKLGFTDVERGLGSAGNAMDNALSGVDVPVDQIANQELQAALAAGRGLPDDLAARFNRVIENRVDPAISGGNLTGKDYQQTVRGIRGYQAETPKPGFEADYRDALGGVESALTGAINRGAGTEVVENLGKANRVYRDFKLLEDAVKKAQGGSASGAQEIFTPAQLQAAVRGSKYAKSGTKEPFGKLTRSGQEVLPSTVPNSGTSDRAMAMALPGLLGAGAAGAGYVDPKAALPLAVLAALSTRGGAKLAQKALTGRSTATRAVGRKIIQQRRKAGLFGASTGVAVLPQSSQ